MHVLFILKYIIGKPRRLKEFVQKLAEPDEK